MQRPPRYSAVKVGGRRAYRYAREGREVEIPERRVTVREFELLSYEPPLARFRVRGSKGLYVRSLARDLGGHVVSLRRLASGPFRVEDAGPELLPTELGDWIKQRPPPWSMFWTAVVCLGIFTSVRVAEQVRAGINSLPRGQRMAGTAMGLTVGQTYRFVLLPQAFRIILPPLTSEFMNVIKNSSVALTIGLLELTGRARAMQEFSFRVFEAFTAATVIYLLTNLVVVLLMRALEKKVRVPGLIAAGGAPQAGH